MDSDSSDENDCRPPVLRHRERAKIREFARSHAVRLGNGDMNPLLRVELEEVRAHYVSEVQAAFSVVNRDFDHALMDNLKRTIPREWTGKVKDLEFPGPGLLPGHLRTDHLDLRLEDYQLKTNEEGRKIVKGFTVHPTWSSSTGPQFSITKALSTNELQNAKILAMAKGVLAKQLYEYAKTKNLHRDECYINSYNQIGIAFKLVRDLTLRLPPQAWETERRRMRSRLVLPAAPNLSAMPSGANTSTDTFFWAQASMYKSLGWRSGCEPGPQNPGEDGMPPVFSLEPTGHRIGPPPPGYGGGCRRPCAATPRSSGDRRPACAHP